MNPSAYTPRYAIEVSGLAKVFPENGKNPPRAALKDVSLKVPRGSVFALLGPSGAGKSTLINILAGLFVKSAGEVWVWDAEIDENPRRARSAIGVVPQEPSLDPSFTPRETLEMHAGFYGLAPQERITDILLDLAGLNDVASTAAHALSNGMRRRLALAKAMAHRPPVLALDEPTTGVDVKLRADLWDRILGMKETGATVFLATSSIEEAERLCDHIAVLHEGKIIAHDGRAALLSRLDKKRITVTVDRDLREVPPNLKPQGWELDGARRLKISARPVRLSFGQMLLSIQVNGLNITDIVTEETDFADVLAQLTTAK